MLIVNFGEYSRRDTVLNNDKWNLGKENQKRLSAQAAITYDSLYEKANFATGSYMRYEIETIKEFSKNLENKDIALDLGSGTGRDSFVLAKYFSQVYGYYFSPEMVREANNNKIKRNIGNVSFSVRDIEEDLLIQENNSVAFVNTAFGMGSFVKSIEKLLQEIKRVLQPEGIAIISCYNSNALVNHLDLKWEPALAARISTERDCLDVKYNKEVYKISSKAYEMSNLRKRIELIFGLNSVLSLTTFPSLAALFPQELFENEKTRKLCTKVDNLLASNEEIAAGPYIVAVIKKSGQLPTKNKPKKGYERVVELLRIHNINLDRNLKLHNPAYTISDIVHTLNIDLEKETMVKSILVTSTVQYNEKNSDIKLYLVGIPAQKRIDFSKLAKILNQPRTRLAMATLPQVEEIAGFSVGSIPPFGLPKDIPVILDSTLENQSEVWCGTGKTTESIKLTINELMNLCTPTFATNIAK